MYHTLFLKHDSPWNSEWYFFVVFSDILRPFGLSAVQTNVRNSIHEMVRNYNVEVKMGQRKFRRKKTIPKIVNLKCEFGYTNYGWKKANIRLVIMKENTCTFWRRATVYILEDKKSRRNCGRKNTWSLGSRKKNGTRTQQRNWTKTRAPHWLSLHICTNKKIKKLTNNFTLSMNEWKGFGCNVFALLHKGISVLKLLKMK